nr:integrase, catalytic region, zinc finger, CCHC-type, peptidase aspartic, catalytic [Tanacetum cinerariifolium]
MSNTNNNMQTQTSNTLHNAIMEAGGKDRPPIGAFTTTETYMENYKNVSQDIRNQLNDEAKAVQIILTRIDNDIYSTVDACPNACEMWKAIERLKQVESINVQDLETNLYWEFVKFTSRDESRAKDCLISTNPLALVAQQQPVYHPQNHPTHYTQNSSTRSQQAATRNKGKAIVNSPPPIYDQEPSMKIYKPTNNNLRTSSNTNRANQDNFPRINRGVGYDNQRNLGMLLENVRNQKGQRMPLITGKRCYCELEAHYMYMAQIQEVSLDAADSGPIFDSEPLQKVSNDDHYNVFAIESEHPEQSKSVHDTYPIEQDEHNVIIDSLDMSYDREHINQSDDDDDLANEHELLASLIEKLKCEIDDSKNWNKFLETSNKILKLSAHQETISILSQAKETQIKLYKTHEDKELDKVIALENKVKVLDNIVYKTGQSIQTMNMLNSKCQTSFAKSEFRKKAQRANPRLYDIGCYNDNLALMLAPESDEVIRLEKESRSKLSDLIRPFDYDKLNNLYDLFVPQRKTRLNRDIFQKDQEWVTHLLSQISTRNQKTQFLNEIDRLSREYYYADHMNAILGVYTELDEVTNLQCDYLELLEKCKCLEKELSKSKMMSKSFKALQKHAINLEIDFQRCQEKITNDKSFKENLSKEFCKERKQYFEIQDLKAQLQYKGIAISELKKLVEKLKGKSVETKFEKSSVIRQPNAFKSQRPSILRKPNIFSDSLERKDFSTSKPQLKSNPMEDRVMLNNSQGKKHEVEYHRRNVKFSKNKTSVTACNESLNAKTLNVNFVCATCGKCVLNEKHDMCVLKSINDVNSRTKIPIDVPLVEIILFIVDSGCSKHMTRNLKLLISFVEKFLGTIKFKKDQIAPILGCGDLVQGVVTIKRVYYVEGLNHNLFSVGQFCDVDLEVGFRKSTCYIRDLKGNDLLKSSRRTYLYSITLQDTNSPNPICLMAKATSSQAWLWHRCLFHLNFDTINLLSKNDMVIGLLKLKFVKDHLCSSCVLGKAK